MEKNNNNYLKIFAAGATQATLVTAVGYPFDLIKTKMQTGNYNTSFQCVKHTLEHNGIRGLYRGATAPWISHLIKRPYQYPVGEYLKTLPESGIIHNYMIGGILGASGAIVGTPLQVIKVGMQTTQNNSNHIYKTTRSFLRNIIKTQGLKGMYRGFAPTVIKDTLFGASFQGHYYTIRDTVGADRGIKTFLSGAIAHCTTWFVFIPIDNIKTIVQKPSATNTKLTIEDAVYFTYQNHGFKGFWRGVVPACIRTVPVSGVAMIGYEFVRNL